MGTGEVEPADGVDRRLDAVEPRRDRPCRESEFFIDTVLVRIHCIIVMIRWTGLALWEFEFPFPGSLTSTFLNDEPADGVDRRLDAIEPRRDRPCAPQSVPGVNMNYTTECTGWTHARC